ncbi:MAG: bifunctional folylpolyglutamate synthase/dihydrofolate synthase [Firmicutes bacterium]|nr:bifunctional folylpolyglutamate synthase/dihydrofolate synthase [Bacillota bacterium]
MELHTYLNNLGPSKGRPGLGRIQYLLKSIGSPENRLKIIHILGTNGKGSTAKFVASILQAAGFKVGLYTSPHLEKFNERIRVNDIPLTDGELAQALDKVKSALKSLKKDCFGLGEPGMFEIATAIALSHFAEAEVDYAVLEAGLGGRFDATHVGDPLLTVITRISLDHTEVLGDTVQLIAGEKAAAIPQNGTVIMGPQVEEAADVIRGVAKKQGAYIVDVGAGYQVDDIVPSVGGTRFRAAWENETQEVQIGMLGLFQVTNAITALAAVHYLVSQGLPIRVDAIQRGLAAAVWPGRLEAVGTRPMIVLDGGHNLDGFQALAESLPEYFSWKKLHLIMAVTGEKLVDPILRTILPLADSITFTAPRQSRTRPISPKQLARTARTYMKEVCTAPSFASAYRQVLKKACPSDLICVCGSLYLVGEARAYLLDSRTPAGI